MVRPALALALLLAAAPSPLALRKLALGDELTGKGDLRGALFAYQDATALDPTSAEARLKLGDAYQRLGHLPQAMRQWEDAALLAPPGAAAKERIARARAGEPAAPEATALVPATPQGERETPAAGPYEAGVALVAKGLFAEALASLDEAVRQDATLAVAYAARGSARFGLGRWGEAAEDYERALALDPDLATPLYGLAECHRLLRRPEAAAEFYRAYAASSAPDARPELQATARRRAEELTGRR